jgi:hypothetical protein
VATICTGTLGRRRRSHSPLRRAAQSVFTLSGRHPAGLMNIRRKTLVYRSRRPQQDATMHLAYRKPVRVTSHQGTKFPQNRSVREFLERRSLGLAVRSLRGEEEGKRTRWASWVRPVSRIRWAFRKPGEENGSLASSLSLYSGPRQTNVVNATRRDTAPHHNGASGTTSPPQAQRRLSRSTRSKPSADSRRRVGNPAMHRFGPGTIVPSDWQRQRQERTRSTGRKSNAMCSFNRGAVGG